MEGRGAPGGYPGVRGTAPPAKSRLAGGAVVFGAGTGAAGVTRPSPAALTRHGPSRHPLPTPRRWVAGRSARGERPRRPLASWGRRDVLRAGPVTFKGPGVAGRCRERRLFARRPVRGQATDRGSRVILGVHPAPRARGSRIATGLLPCPVVVAGVLSASMAFRPSTQGVSVCAAVARPLAKMGQRDRRVGRARPVPPQPGVPG